MAKALFFGVVLAATLGAQTGPTLAQADASPSRTGDVAAGSAGVRSGNITATGATVPNPGASQGAGTTDLDRGVQREDSKIQNSICKGC